MNHKQKLKLARRLRGSEETKHNVPVFQSKAWNERKTAIQEKVERKIKKRRKKMRKKQNKNKQNLWRK